MLALQVGVKLLLDRVMDDDGCKGDGNGPFDALTVAERRAELKQEKERERKRRQKKSAAARHRQRCGPAPCLRRWRMKRRRMMSMWRKVTMSECVVGWDDSMCAYCSCSRLLEFWGAERLPSHFLCCTALQHGSKALKAPLRHQTV